MELEASTLPANYKKDLMETIKQYKRDMAKVERDFK
jgi:vesicle transport through interaction with t-SNAREs protein 1